MIRIHFSLLFILICISLPSFSQRIQADLVAKHISYLSSDALAGRGTGSPEEKLVASYIADQFKGIQLQPFGNAGYFYDFSYKLSRNIHDTSTSGMPLRYGRNVLGFLDNQAEYTVVIGAHHDHLGLGHDGNSLDANPQGKVHNGADDNASGVAGVIELARYLRHNGIRENYNFLFMTFSGEELGLIGSKKWCEKPTLSLEKVNYMINMDMIGRLNAETRKLLIYGVGTSPAWIPALEAVRPNFSIKQDSAGIGPSDQTSFYLKDIPVLHYFTGQHSDYHKPTDDAHKLNINGEAEILESIIDLIFYLDSRPKLTFSKTRNNESTQMSFKVTMGIMPDYTFEGKGLRLDGVTEGKPAAKAGLQSGDIILKMDNVDIRDIKDYMKLLNLYKKGDQVEVYIERQGLSLMKQVEF